MTLIVTGVDAGDFVRGAIAWDLLKGVQQVLRTHDGEIELTECRMVRPYGVACIAALGASRPGMRLRLPAAEECRDHLLRLGIGEYFRTDAQDEPPVRATNVPIENLTSRPGDFASRVMALWEQELGGLPAGMRPEFENHLDEIILNALTHACSPIGAFVVGQAFPRTRIIELAVVDFGQTIRGHLSGNPAVGPVSDDRDAILRATEEAVTGTVGLNVYGEPNSGIGLYELRRFCERGGGEMTILSGQRFVVFSSTGDPASDELWGGFPGTLVNLRLFGDSNALTSGDSMVSIW